MILTYKYRLKPTKKQCGIIHSTLEECRWLYNKLLEQRKNRWEENNKSIDYHLQSRTLLVHESLRPSLDQLYS